MRLHSIIWFSFTLGKEMGVFCCCLSTGMLAASPSLPCWRLADTFNAALILQCLISPQTTLILHRECYTVEPVSSPQVHTDVGFHTCRGVDY